MAKSGIDGWNRRKIKEVRTHTKWMRGAREIVGTGSHIRDEFDRMQGAFILGATLSKVERSCDSGEKRKKRNLTKRMDLEKYPRWRVKEEKIRTQVGKCGHVVSYPHTHTHSCGLCTCMRPHPKKKRKKVRLVYESNCSSVVLNLLFFFSIQGKKEEYKTIFHTTAR